MSDAALEAFCRAIMHPLEQTNRMVRETDDGPGWSALLDPARAPAEALTYLGQFVGVRVTRGATSLRQRNEIVSAAGFRRGRPQAMRDAIAATLSGARTVVMTERVDGNAYQLLIQTYADQTPDPGAAEAAARSQKPAGIVLTFEVIGGQTYAQLAARFGTYGDLPASYPSYADMAADTP